MEDPSTHSDADRELNDLRARAYGPDSDIHADPAARARLIELEAAHLSIPATTPHIDSSLTPAADVGRPAAAAKVVAVPDRAAPTDEPRSKTHPTMTSQRDARSLGHNAPGCAAWPSLPGRVLRSSPSSLLSPGSWGPTPMRHSTRSRLKPSSQWRSH